MIDLLDFSGNYKLKSIVECSEISNRKIMKTEVEGKICKLCERQVNRTTRHHLIPRTLHKNKWFRKNFEKYKMHQTVDLCKDCHRQIHKFIPEKEMGRDYNTIKKLQSHEEVAKFLKWLIKRS